MNPSMDEKETLGYLITGVLPLLISVVQKPEWSDRTRSLVALTLVWLFTFLWWLYMWLSEASAGAITLTLPVVLQLVRMLVVSLVVAMTTYQSVWKPTGVAGAVEVATSPPEKATSPLAREARKDLAAETRRRQRPPKTEEVDA